MKTYTTPLLLVSTTLTGISAFSPMFTNQPTMQRTTPSKTDGVEIELPDFDELFHRIVEVSPLAGLAISGEGGGFSVADEKFNSGLKWKTIESKKARTVFHIDKIDDFQGLGCPMVRFRSSLKGPCVGEKFADFIMTLEEREKWDPQIEVVDEIYPIYDVDAANIAMDFGYGDCTRLGIGYCRTKSNPIVDGREQLTLCGIQELPNNGCIIWGTEMEEWHNNLMPEDAVRLPRAKSHLFGVALVPTGPDSFDVEYILQLSVGGRIPGFLTTPILVETVKSLFNYAKKQFEDEDIMAEWVKKMEDKKEIMINEKHNLLMPV